MSAHLTDELPRLLSGEADRDTVMAAAAHLRTCVDCQQELVSAVVAHASLSSAHRFAPEVVTRGSNADDNAWTTVVRQVPDLSAMFAEVRREIADQPDTEPGAKAAATTGAQAHARHHSPARPLRHRGLLAAAAAVVIVGGGATAVVLATHDNSSTSTGRTVALAAYDKGTSAGTATISGGGIQINATSLPNHANTRYEVWLTDSKRSHMQPIGWVGNDGWAKLSVPKTLMSEYDDVEVSVQDVGQTDYAYSGTSVLRGAID